MHSCKDAFLSRNIHIILTLLVSLLFTSPSAYANLVGTTSGSLSVNQGVANYSIPIAVPPGVAGMQPELSLNYSSQGGNGVLGVGWSIGGLSVIHRCASNLAQDGAIRGVKFDAQDKFCLDGQRLVAIHGAYGGDGTEYRTEVDGYSKIVSYGGNSSGPRSFKVWAKSGQVMSYGMTTDSRVEAQGKTAVKLWALNNIEDTLGNSIQFKYQEINADGEYFLSSIKYAGNTVRFDYSDRPDVSSGYQAGSLTSMSKRLSKVAVLKGTAVFREYRPAYKNDTISGVSQLTSITECTSATDCFPAVTFQWQSSNVDFGGINGSAICANGHGSYGGCNDSDNHSYISYADIDGDGVIDLCYRGDGGIQCYIGDGDGNWGEHFSTDICANGSNKYGVCNDGDNYSTIRFIDMNADGKADLVFRSDRGIRIFSSTGRGFTLQSSSFICANGHGNYGVCNDSDNHSYISYADINGDGITDLCYRGDWGIQCRIGDGEGNWTEHISTDICANNSGKYGVCNDEDNYSTIRFIDMNADGKADLTFRSDQGMRVFFSSGSGFTLQGSSPICANYSGSYGVCNDSDNHSYISYADINGDGITDLCYRGDRGIQCHIGDGDGNWVEHISTDICANSSGKYGVCNDGDNYSTIQFLDMNMDGKADLLFRSDQGMRLFSSTGTGFMLQLSNSICANYSGNYGVCNDSDNHSYISSADINGDSKPDLVYRGDNGIQTWIQRDFKPLLITGFQNGLGVTTKIEYKPLTDESVYTKSPNRADYPVMDVSGPQYVVSRLLSDNGIGGIATTSYRYGESRVHLQGRGPLGFRWVETIDETTGRISYAEQIQDVNHPSFPFNSSESYSEERIKNPNGSETILSSSLSKTEYVSYFEGVYAPRLLKSIDITNDMNGDLLTAVTTENSEYDSAGNIGHIEVTTEGGSKHFKKITESTYHNDTVQWHLGRLIKAAVTHVNWDGSQATRTSLFEYDSQNGLLSKEVIEPDTPQAQTTSYVYDQFGNKTATTISGHGMQPRTTRTTYDNRGVLPVITTNALQHSESRQYHSKCGTVTSLTGPNGLTTQWQYDTSCRKIAEIRADGTQTHWRYAWADRWVSGINGSVYSITKTVSGQPASIVYYDKLGRELRKENIGFDGQKVFQDTQYDTLGRIKRASVPYFEGDTSYWVESEYDRYGRLIETRKPDGYGGWLRSSIEYNRFATISSNTQGQQKTTFKNAIGQTERVEEEEGTWVTYQYDATGNLIQTNANGITTTISYDNRGNKTAMNDPDMGIWEYRYNTFGELVWQKDAKQQETSMDYDLLGRMVKRTEAQGITTWHYDTAAKGIGKLAEVQAPAGFRQQFSYDHLGRPVESKTYADNQQFSVKTQYDQYSRVATVIRPENFKVENIYNDYGYLTAVRSPAQQISDYDLQHLVQAWETLRPQLEQELNQAQQKADEYGARLIVYRQRADTYRATAESLSQNNLLNDQIMALQQAAGTLDELASQLEADAAEYQRIANAILSLMPSRWQSQWFADTMQQYEQKARDIIDQIETAYQVAENSLVWVPIQVGGITTFIQVQPSVNFNGIDLVYLKNIGYSAADKATYLRNLASDARARQAAHQTFQNALANQPATVWVPITVGDITTFIEAPSIPFTPADVLNEAQLAAYNTPDITQLDQVLLARYYFQLAERQEVASNPLERQYVEATQDVSRLSGEQAAYVDMIAIANAGVPEITFWQASSRDASGRLTSEITGNGLVTHYNYEQATGRLSSISSGFGYASNIRHLAFQYDDLDNVISRQDHVQGMEESFYYDRLSRLIQSDVSGQIGVMPYNQSTTYAYNAQGNITYKSDVGSYTYGDQRSHTPGPHAVISAGSNHQNYQYDANGNLTSGGGRNIQWTSFNKPKRFEKEGNITRFTYGPDRSRYLKTANDKRTLYIGKLYEKESEGSTVKHKHFIYGGGQLVAIHIKGINDGVTQPDKTRYLHRDNLGSIDTITDGQGNIVERMSFDAFGKRRAGDWRATSELSGGLILPTLTNRGYTGHEHVDEMGLIHMNGRVYDPTLGRFLSADPNIQAPHNSQSYNRYSYVMNNPLKYTDPSGYFWKKIKKAVKNYVDMSMRVSGLAAAKRYVQTHAWAQTALQIGAAFLGPGAAALTSIALARMNGGTWKQALKAGALTAASAFAAGAIGGQGWDLAPASLAHGVSQGAIAELGGGEFKTGFWGGAIGHAVSGFMTPGNGMMSIGQGGVRGVALRTAVAAVAGGTVAVLGGGKFANGAKTAAFVHLFNAESSTILQKILPAHTARFSRKPIGGSPDEQIKYANTVNMIRSKATVSGHFAGPKGVNIIVDQALMRGATNFFDNQTAPSR